MKTRLVRLRTLVADRRFLDAALVLGCLILTALAVKGLWSPVPRPVIALAGVVGSLAQWPRRRWPQVAALVGAGTCVLSGNPGPALVGLYSAAAYAPRRQVWALAVAGWVGLAGWSWLDAGQLRAVDVAAWALVTGLVVAFGAYMATRNLLMASLRERAERAEAERLLREERARAAERTHIAREMHDVLAHKVSLIALHAGALELHATGDPAPVHEGAALIRVTAREALQELRNVLGVLQAEPGEQERPSAWFGDLASLVEASGQAGQHVELDDGAGPLPPATARVVYRIVQEGLTNAHRHAPGARTTISVRGGDGGEVAVTVDNEPGAGVPIDLPGSGSGLVGLAERIRLVGGSLQAGPSGRDGWQLRAVVPWLDQRVEEAKGTVQ
jgi:signal transduction histidine kinase